MRGVPGVDGDGALATVGTGQVRERLVESNRELLTGRLDGGAAEQVCREYRADEGTFRSSERELLGDECGFDARARRCSRVTDPKFEQPRLGKVSTQPRRSRIVAERWNRRRRVIAHDRGNSVPQSLLLSCESSIHRGLSSRR